MLVEVQQKVVRFMMAFSSGEGLLHRECDSPHTGSYYTDGQSLLLLKGTRGEALLRTALIHRCSFK